MEAAAHDLSIWGLFMQADVVVKAVMVGLVLLSIWSWSVAIDKWLQFGALKNGAVSFEKRFWSGAPIEELEPRAGDKSEDAAARVYLAGAREWREGLRGGVGLTAAQAGLLQERCDRMMQAAIQRETARAARGLPVLATIGSAAPFIGLFGTVWGIMNAFTAIARVQETNLAVVAPGIAEALFATALGLAASIPAVVFYNKFTGDLDRFADQLDGLADEFAARLSRRLEERVR